MRAHVQPHSSGLLPTTHCLAPPLCTTDYLREPLTTCFTYYFLLTPHCVLPTLPTTYYVLPTSEASSLSRGLRKLQQSAATRILLSEAEWRVACGLDAWTLLLPDVELALSHWRATVTRRVAADTSRCRSLQIALATWVRVWWLR